MPRYANTYDVFDKAGVLVAHGTTKELADELCVSPCTIWYAGTGRTKTLLHEYTVKASSKKKLEGYNKTHIYK